MRLGMARAKPGFYFVIERVYCNVMGRCVNKENIWGKIAGKKHASFWAPGPVLAAMSAKNSLRGYHRIGAAQR